MPGRLGENHVSEGRKMTFVEAAKPRLQQIHFHTFRHWKATKLSQNQRPLLRKRLLGHKELRNAEIYINIEHAVFEPISDEFTVGIAEKPEEVKPLIEVGFGYVCQKGFC